MTGNFTFPAAGFSHELSPRARRQLSQQFPDLPVGSIEEAITSYVMLRDAQPPEPGEARNALRAVRRQAHKLRQSLYSERFARVESFVRQCAVASKVSIDLDELRRITLTDLADVCAAAASSIPMGGGRLVGLVLEELGEEGADIPRQRPSLWLRTPPGDSVGVWVLSDARAPTASEALAGRARQREDRAAC